MMDPSWRDDRMVAAVLTELSHLVQAIPDAAQAVAGTTDSSLDDLAWRLATATATYLAPNPAERLRELAREDRPASFREWLAQFASEESAIGDLARDAAADRSWPPSPAGRDELVAYLTDRDAAPEAIDTLLYAWQRYQVQR